MSAIYWRGRTTLVDGPHDRLAQIIPFDQADEVTWEKELTCGLKISSHRGGMVLFNFSAIPKSTSAPSLSSETTRPESFSLERSFAEAVDTALLRAKVINAWILCVHSSALELNDFSPDVFRVGHRDLIHTDDLARGRSGEALEAQPFISGIGYANKFVGHRATLPAVTLDDACTLLDVIIAAGVQVLDLVDLISLAADALGDHNYAVGVTTVWSACEAMLQMMLRIHLEKSPPRPDSPPITRKRRKNILEGRDYSASVIIEILALAGVLSSAEYDGLTEARKVRNSWIHNMSPADMESGRHALETTLGLLARNFNVKLTIYPNLQIAM